MLSRLARTTRSPIASAAGLTGMRFMSTKKVFVVCCNPIGESFSHAIADSCEAGLKAGDKEV